MRTSLTETQLIEGYLQGKLPEGERLVAEARMLTEADFAEKVKAQQATKALVQQYGRRQLRAELHTIHHTLFTSPAHSRFRRIIRALFK